MDSNIAQLILQSNGLTTEEIAVLMFLMANAIGSMEQKERDERIRGNMFSTLNVNEICQRYNFLDSTVNRIVNKFEGIGWLSRRDNGVVLGHWRDGKKHWHCAKALGKCKITAEQKETPLQQLRRMVAESKKQVVVKKIEKLSVFDTAMILNELREAKPKTPGMRALNLAKEAYVKKFGKAYPLSRDLTRGVPSFPKEIKLWNNALMYVDNDEQRLFEIIRWTFDNWDAVREKLAWVGTPNVSLFCTKSYLLQIIGMSTADYLQKITVGTRYNEAAAQKAPSEGFE